MAMAVDRSELAAAVAALPRNFKLELTSSLRYAAWRQGDIK